MIIDQIKYMEAFCFFADELREKTEIQAPERTALIMNILQSLNYINSSFGNKKTFPIDVESFQTVIEINAEKIVFNIEGKSVFYKEATINTAHSLFQEFLSLNELARNFSTSQESIIKESVKRMADQWALFCNQVQTDKIDASNHLKGQPTLMASLWQKKK